MFVGGLYFLGFLVLVFFFFWGKGVVCFLLGGTFFLGFFNPGKKLGFVVFHPAPFLFGNLGFFFFAGIFFVKFPFQYLIFGTGLKFERF